MEVSVVPWFQMLPTVQKAHLIPTWAALARAIEEEFAPSLFECPRAQLFIIQVDPGLLMITIVNS